jgi:pimeloyl-ACP methyl ester carboxylesterase
MRDPLRSIAGAEITRFAARWPDRVEKPVYLDSAHDFDGYNQLLAANRSWLPIRMRMDGLCYITPGSRRTDRRGFVRLSHEPGLRPCHRCKRRTLWVCEDCGRATCLDCKIIETVRLGGRSRRRLMCARCHFAYRAEDLPGSHHDVWEAIVRRIQASGEVFPAP